MGPVPQFYILGIWEADAASPRTAGLTLSQLPAPTVLAAGLTHLTDCWTRKLNRHVSRSNNVRFTATGSSRQRKFMTKVHERGGGGQGSGVARSIRS
eukprot:gene4092-biopygen11392